MADLLPLTSSISLSNDFHYGEVPASVPAAAIHAAAVAAVAAPDPPLGPLVHFAGEWVGNGFNTIFRPDSKQTPTKLPIPLPDPPLPGGLDNILELNLTLEHIVFSKSLGTVPNRGTSPQGDIRLNGVPYLQTVKDVTSGVGIHAEPGLWMAIPSTNTPTEGPTLTRMASIPHGTTINAQGTSKQVVLPLQIPAVDITPFVAGQTPIVPVPFPSQQAANNQTFRIPQDLSTFIAAGTITQAILTDPNTVLRNHIGAQTILDAIEISISTNPGPPLFAGGTDNIAFLTGDAAAASPNAQTTQMAATFWIETVEETITLPIFKHGDPPLLIKGASQFPGQVVPTFHVVPASPNPAPRPIKVQYKQIQYSQLVLLVFHLLAWPHVSVATLVPEAPIVVHV